MLLPNMIQKSELSLTNLETLARLETLYQTRRAEQKRLANYRDYYHGDHPTLLTERQREFLRYSGRFCLNYCRVVIDAVAERLTVSGFDTPDANLRAWLWELWNMARLDSLSKAVHLAAVRDGESFLIVDFAEGSPRFHLNQADDGSGGVSIHTDSDGQILYAAKRWTVDSGINAAQIRRMNLYYADRIEKYVSTTVAPYWQLLGEPIPWVDQWGEPLGLPVIRFQNREGGTSEISDVIPLQDAINKALLDLIAVADKNAFPLLVAQGFDLPADFTFSAGDVIQIPPSLDGNTDFKLIQGANLDQFIQVLGHLVMEMARVSSTPLSRFQVSGQTSAEGTLKQQEAGLISKVEHKQVSFGNGWEDAMRLAIRVQNNFGARQFAEGLPLSTLWSPAATRSESDHLQVLLMKAQLGVPLETLLAEAGYQV